MSMLTTASPSFKPQLGHSMIWIQSSSIMKVIINFSWSCMFSPCQDILSMSSEMICKTEKVFTERGSWFSKRKRKSSSI